jgi:serine/threonine protein kinase
MADRAGQQLGAYQLISLLAQSSTAEVYRGEQRYSHIEVAIKLLRRPLATSEEIDHFRAEARDLATLIHPHIVRVLSFDVEQGSGYLVMDYAPHGTLRQRYPRGEPVALEAILPAIQQTADALHAAHEQGSVHQDLKPESLLVGRQDEILVGGFRLNTAYPPTDAQEPQEIRGAAAYMAPEQFQGKPGPASDQYALGIIVYEWLSGSLPFEGSAADLAKQHLTVAPPPLRSKAPAVSPEAERVIMRALAKDPAKRFATIQAFAAALTEAAQAQPAAQAAAVSSLTSAAPGKQGAKKAAAQAAPARTEAPHPAAPHTPAGQSHARGASPQGAAGLLQPAQPQPPAERFAPPPPQPGWQGQPTPPYVSAPPQQGWTRQPTPSAWQRPPTPARSSRASNVGCIIALIVVAVIALAYLFAH